MLKLAAIDHHLNNWHADTFLRLLRGPLAGERVEITAAWESDPEGEDWCAKNGVRRATSIDDAIRGADAVMLLAPSSLHAHLPLAQAVLPHGLPTMVDKLLAPSVPEAERIAELSAQYGAPIFSASALRYAVELEAVMPQYRAGTVASGRFTGMGDWSDYGVHTVALPIRVLGPAIRRVADTGAPGARVVTLDYGDGRRALVDVREAGNGYEALLWNFTARVGEDYVGGTVADLEGIYGNTLVHAIEFFRSGISDVTIDEALAHVRVLEAADRSLTADGAWVTI